MRRKNITLVSAITLIGLWVLAISDIAVADSHGYYKEAGGLAVYFGILPAAMIQGHPREHPEATMHSGAPAGRHRYHIMAAIFDGAGGERIENATVAARVTPLGFAAVTRPLQPMVIADTVTYGNYFTLHNNGPYRIVISVRATTAAGPVNQEFTYEYRQGAIK